MRYLIINADDFGYSAEVNTAIVRAHTEGILTSTSLMVAERAFPEAVELARQHPRLGVGLHLVLSNDRALLPVNEIPLLTQADGKFGADLFGTGVRYAFSKRVQRQVRREMEAQFARFAETSLPWSHLDGHQHFHLHPFIWDNLLDLCDQYGVHRLRIPHEEVRAHFAQGKRAGERGHAAGKQGVDGPNLNTVFAAFLRAMRRRNLRALQKRKMLGGKRPFLCDRVYGQLQTGNMHLAYALGLLERLGGQVNEIYFHPGAPHARPLMEPVNQLNTNKFNTNKPNTILPNTILPNTTNSAFSERGINDVELHALLSPRLRDRIAELSITTGTYQEIEELRQKN